MAPGVAAVPRRCGMKNPNFWLVVLPQIIEMSRYLNFFSYFFFFFFCQCLPLAVLLLWWGIRLSATPLQNKGVAHIAAQNYRAQMQLFVFVLAGVLAAVGAMRFAGRI